ncbi:maltase A1-like [Arctopsyche grandis]|uniref:maltase A1-like n=1 Tax=Arctopsyche grandis TaxID=121162 RepID=UPI00406D6E79
MSDAEVSDKMCQTTDVFEASSPFQWDDSANAGFSTNPNPWYPVAKNYKSLNLKTQKSSPNSSLKMYKDLAGLREAPMIKSEELDMEILSDGLLYLVRDSDGFDEIIVVLLNFGSFAETADLSSVRDLPEALTVILTSEGSGFKMGDTVRNDRIKIYAGEGLVFLATKNKCEESKPVDKIVNKLTDAAQKAWQRFAVTASSDAKAIELE